MQDLLYDTTEIDAELGTSLEKMTVVKELLIKWVEGNTKVQQDQEKFWNKYNLLEERYEKAKARVKELQFARREREQKLETIGAFMFEIHERDGFFPSLYCSFVF